MSEESVSRKSKREALTPSYCEHPGCDWPYKIQRHRIFPGRSGGKYKLGNVIGLCPNHHWMADEGLLTAEYLQEIVNKRIEESAEPKTEPEAPAGASATEERGDRAPEEPDQGTGECSTDARDGIAAGSASS